MIISYMPENIALSHQYIEKKEYNHNNTQQVYVCYSGYLWCWAKTSDQPQSCLTPHLLLLSPGLLTLGHLGVLSTPPNIPELRPSLGLWTWDSPSLRCFCLLYHITTQSYRSVFNIDWFQQLLLWKLSLNYNHLHLWPNLFSFPN